MRGRHAQAAPLCSSLSSQPPFVSPTATALTSSRAEPAPLCRSRQSATPEFCDSVLLGFAGAGPNLRTIDISRGCERWGGRAISSLRGPFSQSHQGSFSNYRIVVPSYSVDFCSLNPPTLASAPALCAQRHAQPQGQRLDIRPHPAPGCRDRVSLLAQQVRFFLFLSAASLTPPSDFPMR